jgi:hypothetical protein
MHINKNSNKIEMIYELMLRKGEEAVFWNEGVFV